MITLGTGLVWVTTATTGTGTLTLGAAKSGWNAVPAALDGKKVTYTIHSAAGKEIGEGTYTHSGTTLSRDTVFASTNAGAKVSLTGTSEVFLDAAPEDFNWARDVQPAAPADGLRLFSLNRAGRTLAQVDPAGAVDELQEAVCGRMWGLARASGGTTVIQAGSMASLSGTGTVSAQAATTTNRLTSNARIRHTPASAAINTAQGFRAATGAAASLFLSSTAGLGGFFVSMQWGFNAFAAGNRGHFGLAAADLAGTDVPAALLNQLAVGFDQTESTWQFLRNDGSGTATKVSTGISVESAKLYEFRAFARAGVNNSVDVAFIRHDDGSVVTQTFTTDLPASGTLMGVNMKASTGTLTAGPVPEFVGLYYERPW